MVKFARLQTMRIYVDFDDVLCETARSLSVVVHKLFGCAVPYEKITQFNLKKSFSLSDEQMDILIRTAHAQSFLSKIPETPGAVEAIRTLLKKGDQFSILTGRPAASFKGSINWLSHFGLEKLPLLHVDKYARAGEFPQIPGQPPTLTVAEMDKMAFDVAIDDSPMALDLLAKRNSCRVLVFDRPWNRHYSLSSNMRRVSDWKEILSLLPE